MGFSWSMRLYSAKKKLFQKVVTFIGQETHLNRVIYNNLRSSASVELVILCVLRTDQESDHSKPDVCIMEGHWLGWTFCVVCLTWLFSEAERCVGIGSATRRQCRVMTETKLKTSVSDGKHKSTHKPGVMYIDKNFKRTVRNFKIQLALSLSALPQRNGPGVSAMWWPRVRGQLIPGSVTLKT